MSDGVIFALACSAIAILYGVISIKWILAQPEGNERMREIAGAVREGAVAYLKRQYTTIAIVGVVIFLVVAWLLGIKEAIGFLIGAVLSGIAGDARGARARPDVPAGGSVWTFAVAD